MREQQLTVSGRCVRRLRGGRYRPLIAKRRHEALFAPWRNPSHMSELGKWRVVICCNHAAPLGLFKTRAMRFNIRTCCDLRDGREAARRAAFIQLTPSQSRPMLMMVWMGRQCREVGLCLRVQVCAR
jgi:hypothetical protein